MYLLFVHIFNLSQGAAGLYALRNHFTVVNTPLPFLEFSGNSLCSSFGIALQSSVVSINQLITNMPPDPTNEAAWLEVIARALAFFALQHPEIRDRNMLGKAGFLSGLGFSEQAAAEILGTTSNSLGGLKRLAAKNKKGRKNVGKKKGK
ncbi:MAG TPA: hypothetical protein VGH51_07790 [Candidatus Angelobacter sp.]